MAQRRRLSKMNRKDGLWPGRQTGRASPPFSKAVMRERRLKAFHNSHVWVGSYPDAKWVPIAEEE